ncbi:MAG: hypothetical protein ACI9HK_001252 [Pirellulaceae bacterium]|jgi:hypothetical protein
MPRPSANDSKQSRILAKRKRRALKLESLEDRHLLATITGGTGTGGFELTNNTSDLRMWLDSTDQSTLFTDTAGATQVTGNGDSIARWNDKSGYGVDVSQNSGGNRPVYVSTTGMNGRSAIGFVGGGGGDALTSISGNSTGITGNADRTIINVWTSTGFTSQNYQHTFHMGDTTCQGAYGISAARAGNAGSAIGNHHWCSGYDTSAVAGTNPTIAIAAWDGDGGGGANGLDQWHVNGADVGGQDRAALTTGAGQIQIGSRLDPFTEGFSGNLTEVIVYDRVLSDAERISVENALSAKYGITIAADVYAGDEAANGDNDYDVFGIGQGLTGAVTSAGAAGFGIEDTSGSLAPGESIVAGHDGDNNSYTVDAFGRRWTRSWYVDKTGAVDATLAFDHTDAGLSAPGVVNYALMYSADGTTFTQVGGAIAVVTGDTVTFALTNAQINDGFYTLADETVVVPPVITVSAGNASYDGVTAAAVDAGATVVDADSTNLVGATVSITSGLVVNQDQLNFTNQNGISGSYNGVSGVLTLSGTSSVANYQTAIRSIAFSSTGTLQSTADRVVEIIADDGLISSTAVTRTVAVSAPVITSGTGPGGIEKTDGTSALRMWLDSTDTSTLFTDTAGSTPVTTTGESIARWNDKSGYNVNVEQGGAGNRPTYTGSIGSLNNQAAVSFVGGSGGDALSSPTGNNTAITGNDDRTVINVFANTGFTSQNYQHTFQMGSTAGDQAYGISSSRAGNAGSAIGNHYWGAGFDSTAVASTAPNIATAAWNGGPNTDSWYVNGNAAGVLTRGALNTGTNEIQIGSRLAPFTEGFTGSMTEVILYDRVLNSAERTIVDNHLSAKYDIVIGNNRYAGDDAVNGDYDQDVVGIGRDDANNVVAAGGLSGFGLQDWGGSLSDGEYVLAGHSGANNSYAAEGAGRRWTQTWYVDTTGGVDAVLSFDHSDTGRANPGAVTFSLLYSADGVAFAPVAGAASVAGDQVSFAVTDAQLLDGYYTLADDTPVFAPVITTSAGNASYAAGALGVDVDPGVTITDADSTDLVSVTVSITDGFAVGIDSLSFVNQLGIAGSFDANTGVLTLTGTSAVANYQTAIRSIEFSNPENLFSNTTRTIEFTATDALVGSVSVTRGVDVSIATVSGGTGPGGTDSLNGTSSLRMWLDSTDSATIFSDSAGTTTANDSDQVARWNDKSGYAVDVVQTNPAIAPSLTGSVANLNGQPAISFVGGATGDALTSPAGNSTGIVGNADRTIFNVFANTGFTGQNYQHTFHMGSTNCQEAYGISSSRAGNAGSAIGNHFWCAGFDSTATASTNSNIAAASWNGAVNVDSWHVNGDFVGAQSRAALNTGSNEIQIGSRLAPAVEGFTGNLSEVLVYNRVLNTAERAIVDNYLAAKYDIGIGDDHYTGDTPANGNYDHDVFGIGRDDSANQLASGGSAGLSLKDMGSLDDGDYLLAGHNGGGTTFTATSGGQRWTRTWYVEKTGNIDASLTFDHSDVGITMPGGATFSLLYSPDGASFSPVAGATAAINGDQISFDISDADLSSGYYTLGDDTPSTAPVVTANAGTTLYQVTNAAVAIDANIAVTDADDTNLQGATVAIIGGADSSDSLGFDDQLGITGSYDSGAGILTLTGTASVADYQIALQSVTFENQLVTVGSGTRTVAIQAFDGTAYSDSATTKDIVVTRAPLTSETAPGGFEYANGTGSLRTWLDSTDASTLFTDSAGTTSVANNGDPIARWNDKSGYAVDVVQTNGANTPAYVDVVGNLNAQAAVGFTGGNGGDALTSPTGNSTGIIGNDDRTVINVFANTGFTSQNYQHTFHMGDTNCNSAYGISSARAGNAGSAIGNHHWCSGFDTTAIASTNSNIAVAAWDGDGGTGPNGLDQWHVNGADVGADDRAPLQTGAGQLQIGSRLSPFTEGFTGNLTEVLLYERVLNTAERSIVENHLSAKYDIGITDNRYDGDDNANGDYDDDVFGIGRDDAANLVKEAGSAGFGFSELSSSPLADGSYLLAGHNSVGNSFIPIPLAGERVWFVDKVGTVDAQFNFSFTAAGMSLPGAADEFSLLYSPSEGGAFIEVSFTPVAAGNIVTFDVPDADLQDGYYTIGINLNVPPTVDAGGDYTIDEGQPLTVAGTTSDGNGDPVTLSWDLNGDGTFGDLTGASGTLTWAQLQALSINDGPATFSVTLLATDIRGATATDTVTLTVDNVAPTADAGGSYSLAEGEDIVLTGTGTDPVDTVTLNWDLDGDTLFDDATGASPTILWADLVAAGVDDGPGTFSIAVQADDGQGATHVATATIDITNSNPSVSIAATNSSVTSLPVTFDLLGSDPSGTDETAGFTYAITWGDGTSNTLLGPNEPAVTQTTHAFSEFGVFDVIVAITDKDGGTSTATHQIAIVPVAKVGNDVLVGGSQTESDRIIVQQAGDDSIFVRLNNERYGAFDVSPTSVVRIFGGGGNDRITITNCIETEIYGGTGNDRIHGGSCNDVIFGEEGRDIILAGEGDNWVSGGDGNDEIFGRSGDDFFLGDAGNDLLSGGSGSDQLFGGLGNDQMLGGNQDDLLVGDLGNDIMIGGSGDDVLIGGAGNDTIRGDNGNDFLVGGLGLDHLHGQRGLDAIVDGAAVLEDDLAAQQAALLNWSISRLTTNLGAFASDGEVDGLFGGGGRDDYWGGAEDNIDVRNVDSLTLI